MYSEDTTLFLFGRRKRKYSVPLPTEVQHEHNGRRMFSGNPARVSKEAVALLMRLRPAFSFPQCLTMTIAHFSKNFPR